MEEREIMKRGDLVVLSAYGKKVKRAEWIQHDDVGIITRILPYKNYIGHDGCEYEVHWLKSRNSIRRWHHNRLNQRSDLKYAKSHGTPR